MRVGSKCVFISVALCLLYTGSGSSQRPGRKIRLRQYEIQFGRWPLMEITKLSKNPHKVKGSLGGFMQNAIQHNINPPLNHGIKFGPFPQKFNGPPFPQGVPQGPPPPGLQMKPVFFANLKSPMPPAPLPIGPLKQQGNQNRAPIFITGPPPLPQAVPVQVQTSGLALPGQEGPKFGSVMAKSAYSGYFGQASKNNHVNTFPPGPPPGFGGPVIMQGRGPQFRDNQGYQSVNRPSYRPGPPYGHGPPPVVVGDVVSTPRLNMNKVPQVPPVIKIGSMPPEGYSMTHGEQQLITLKFPDVRMNRKMDPESLLKGAEYKFGHEMFNPFGRDESRRQDNFNNNNFPNFNNFNFNNKPQINQNKKVEKKLPDVGAIYTVNMVLQTPNISAPMNGSDSEHFQQGMEEMHRIYGNSNKQSPLDAQVKLLGKLFTELQRLKPPKVNAEESSHIPYRREGDLNFVGEDRSPYKPKVDAPLMAVHIQSYTVPEAGSVDPDVLESTRMFGLQGHRIEFGNTNEIINLMDTAQKAVTSRIPVTELGNSRREVNHNLQEWIKAYVTLARKMNQQAHAKGENIANKSFRQNQFHMAMQNQQMQPMDPKMFSQGASITNAGAVATYQG